MGFLTPLLLALGAAIAVPLILHLIHRQHGPRLVFPALRYLRRAEKEHARRIKLRQLLLLALRVGAIALLAVAAARPFVDWGGEEHRPTAAVIILDNSMSTGVVIGERRVLDVLKDRALQTLRRAGPDDRFWLIRAATPWAPAVPLDPAAAAQRVRETNVAGAAADLSAAVERARTLLAAGAGERATEIQLLSDLQASSFPGAIAAQDDGPRLIVWTPRETAPPNAAVGPVTVGGGLPPLANVRSTVTAEVLGRADADSTTVRLVVAGRVSGVATSPVGATAVLPFPARTAGLVHGWIEIDPDALRGDDRRYFAVRVRPPPSVALTEPQPFLDEALQVLAAADRIRPAERGAAEILLAPGGVGADALRSGRSVAILPPASRLELPAANQRLAAAGLPWRFAAADARGQARFDLQDDHVDPLLRPLADVQLRQTYRLVAEDGAAAAADSVLLRLRDGEPWALRGELPDGGRYVLLASPLSAAASTVPTTPAMLPLMDRLLGAWLWNTSGHRGGSRAPGDLVALPPGADGIERPDGTRDAVRSASEYRAPAEPGIYRVLAGDRALDAFAVNPPVAESSLERLDRRRLAAAFPEWPVALASDSAGWAGSVYHERLGREAWRPFLLLALAVLLIEGLIATAGGTRRHATPGETAEPTHERARARPRRRTPAAAGKGA